jgi:type II secretory pathway component PulJ
MQLMMTSPCRRVGGFTLMESLVSTLLLMMVSGTIYGVLRHQLFALRREEIQLDAQETCRNLIDLITREVRLAGYDPTCSKSFSGIADARPQWLQVQADLNEDGAIGANESITYSYDPDLKAIQRAAGGAPVSLVSDIPGNALAFTYYDGSGAVLAPVGSPPALAATQRNAIRRIKVSISVQRTNPDPRNDTPVRSALVGNVDLRNRFLSSGVVCP